MSKVSIIIPVYNVEKYLRQCLDSVLNQTYKNIEIICVDDGSPDNCPQILDEYAAKDSRIRVLHQENKGQAAARNNALPYVSGKYILYVDSDDWLKPDLLERTIAKADETNADMIWFFYEHPYMASQKVFKNIERIINKYSVFDVEQIPFRDCMRMITFPAVWSKLWRTDFIKKHNLDFAVDENGRGLGHEDIAHHWIALLNCPKSVVIPERFYQYRDNANSSMTNPDLRYSNSIPKTEELMKQALLAKGLYSGKWKELFLWQKLVRLQNAMQRIAPQYKEQVLRDIHESIGSDERKFLSDKNNNLPWHVKMFYKALDGSIIARIGMNGVPILRNIKRILQDMRNFIRTR